MVDPANTITAGAPNRQTRRTEKRRHSSEFRAVSSSVLGKSFCSRCADLCPNIWATLEERGEFAPTEHFHRDIRLGRHGGIAWTMLKEGNLSEEVTAVTCGDNRVVYRHFGGAFKDDEELISAPALVHELPTCRKRDRCHETGYLPQVLLGDPRKEWDLSKQFFRC